MPAARSKLQTHSLAYLGLAALFLLSVAYCGQSVFDRFDAMWHAGEYVREPFYLGDANWGVVGLNPEAEVAGLKFGNELLEVSGRRIDGFNTYYGVLRHARTGDQIHVRVRAFGETAARDVAITLRPYVANTNAAGLAGYVDFALRAVALPLVCIALGFWVAAVRIGDRPTWLLLVVLLSLAAYISAGSGAASMFGRDGVVQPLFMGYRC